MSQPADNNPWGRYRKAMSASTELTQQDKKREALRLLDDAIAMAESENENRWVLTLSHHAANISRFLEDLPRVKYYYLEFLKFNPDTEKFTQYQLPTRGSETRYIQVDNSTTPPTVWIPYDRVNKIARIQMR